MAERELNVDDRNRRIRHLSTIGDPEPGDEQAGEWSRDHLLRMDEKFRRRLERAIERGKASVDSHGSPTGA